LAKIELDKYYTPPDLAEYIVNKTKEVIGEENITEWLEPSAGSGVFLNYLPEGTLAYDIEPDDNRVMKQDFLTLELDYKKGRCVVGNPPFGKGNYTSVNFFQKAIIFCDYISFIQPISQLNNNMYMYQFDLVYSENLGKKKYTDREIHCCLNIYKRNVNGYNSKPNYDLKDITLKGVARGKSRNDKIPDDYDFSISAFGNIGTVCEYEYQYCQQIYFIIHNKKHKNKVLSIIQNTDWKNLYDMTATPKLKHWMINKYLKEQIPELELKQNK
jgi:predicted RNA methylase